MRAVEVLGVLLLIVLAASFGALVVYAAVFLALATAISWKRDRPDPLAAELDRVLEEIVRRSEPAPARGRPLRAETSASRALSGPRQPAGCPDERERRRH